MEHGELQLQDASTEQKLVIGYHSLVSEVHSGGFQRYFSYSHEIVPWTQQAMKEFGCTLLDGVLDRALAIIRTPLPGWYDHEGWNQRVDEVQFQQLDQAIWDLGSTYDEQVDQFVWDRRESILKVSRVAPLRRLARWLASPTE